MTEPTTVATLDEAVPAPREAAARLEAWLRARRLKVLLLILLAAVLVRGIGFAQYLDSPATVQHEWAQSDMHLFDQWAQVLAEGDWLLDRPLHPYHRWHERVAAAWFDAHPEVLRDLTSPSGADNIPPGQRLWDMWYGGKRFHQEPLYPYSLALIERLLSPEVRLVVLLQMIAGVATTLILVLLVRRLAGELAGVSAGALAVLCPLLPYYETLLLRESLIVLATIGLLWLTQIALDHRRWIWWGIAGAGLGLAMMLKSTFLLYGLSFVVGLVILNRQMPRDVMVRVGAYVAGAVVALAPVMVRNVMVGVGPLELSSVGAATFAASNAADRRTAAGFAPQDQQIARIMGESRGAFGPAVHLTLRTHPGIGSLMQLISAKVGWAFHWYEAPNNASFYYYAERIPVLQWLPVRYATLAALAIAGAVLGLAPSRRRTLWPVYAMLVSAMIVLLAFDVSSRLRMPVVAAMLPLAGIGLAGVIEATVGRRWLAAGGLIVLTVASWLIIQRPMPEPLPLIRSADYGVAIDRYYVPQIEQAMRRGALDRVAHLYDEALDPRPASLDAAATFADVPPDERSLARRYAVLHARYATFLSRYGNPVMAEIHAREAQRLEALSQTPSE